MYHSGYLTFPRGLSKSSGHLKEGSQRQPLPPPDDHSGSHHAHEPAREALLLSRPLILISTTDLPTHVGRHTCTRSTLAIHCAGPLHCQSYCRVDTAASGGRAVKGYTIPYTILYLVYPFTATSVHGGVNIRRQHQYAEIFQVKPLAWRHTQGSGGITSVIARPSGRRQSSSQSLRSKNTVRNLH